MNAKRTAGAVAGSLVAGLAITALILKGERDKGKPSELADLARTSARKLGMHPIPPAGRLPDRREQAVIQGGHLLLSAAAGLTYAAVVDNDANPVVAGLGFGAAFYVAMHWLAGPLLGVKRPEWQADRSTIGMHTLNHLAFGLVTAAGARAATRL